MGGVGWGGWGLGGWVGGVLGSLGGGATASVGNFYCYCICHKEADSQELQQLPGQSIVSFLHHRLLHCYALGSRTV